MTLPDAVEGPVTVMISRRIKPGREPDFETWLAGITQEAHNFPGYLGANVIKPSGSTQPEFVTIFRSDSYMNLAQWEYSAVRQRWLQLTDEMAESENEIRRLPGLEFWFTPGRSTLTPPRCQGLHLQHYDRALAPIFLVDHLYLIYHTNLWAASEKTTALSGC